MIGIFISEKLSMKSVKNRSKRNFEEEYMSSTKVIFDLQELSENEEDEQVEKRLYFDF